VKNITYKISDDGQILRLGHKQFSLKEMNTKSEAIFKQPS
jgi:hypothetical protein